MSLAREIALHMNDDTWVREAFGKVVGNLTQVPTMRNKHSLDWWFKDNIGRPLHKGGADKDALRNMRRTFRSIASQTLKQQQAAVACPLANGDEVFRTREQAWEWLRQMA